MKQEEIFIKSTLDGTMQPSLLYRSENAGRPLLVGLHTWSYDRFNQVYDMVESAEKYDFNLILPEFRGPNLAENPIRTEACGSLLAKQDIKDAVDCCVKELDIDRDNIFLLGASGGGHMALLMAGFCPEYFKAIGAFVGITDLEKWADENDEYTEHILACCSNDKEEMKKRSPMNYVETIAKANLKIFHGKYDNSVPFTHSMKLYNEIISNYPDAKVYLEIFDGGHTMDMEDAMRWILSQYKKVEKKTVTG